jgi:large subunit ribosomal protein L5
MAEDKEKKKKAEANKAAGLAKKAKAKAEAAQTEEQADEVAQQPAPPARLIAHYREKVVPALTQQFGYKNQLAVPRLEKIVISMGLGTAVANKEKGKMDTAEKELSIIAGQKPVRCKAKKSVANFKIREGEETGLKVTLRGIRMYEFLDRLISIAMPRIRDFRGAPSRSFDGQGNYSLGVKEQIIFPEIQYDQIDQIRGMDITITTTATDNRHGRALLEAFNFPFRK